MKIGRLDRRVTILTRTTTRDSRFNTRTGTWGELATVWAEVQDILPSRADRVSDDISLTRRPARLRMRWRDDVSQANRIRIDGRDMRIVSGPAEMGRREGLELIVEELSTEGSEP